MFVCGECGHSHADRGFCPADGTALVATDDPLLGTELERYRLARLLGRGGMGRVYLGVQPAIGSRVAIKILSDECASDPVLLDRFFAEARAVNLIRHERIVSVLDMAQLPTGQPFIVMEYIEGQTLARLVQGRSLPLDSLVMVLVEVLSALAAAHAIGIVHRDLKPENILITLEGHAKVLDFGVAKFAPSLAPSSPRTRTGEFLGTPQYMAPEQIDGGTIDLRTDIYAAGVVAFEAMTGRPPFVNATPFALMRAHLEDPPPPPRSLRPDLPVELERVILRALAKRPADRFQSATEMADALSAAISDGARRQQSTREALSTPRFRPSDRSRPTPPAYSVAVPPKPKRRGRAFAIGGLALAAGAAVAVVAVTRGDDPAPIEATTVTPVPAVSPPTPPPPPPVALTPPPTPPPRAPVDAASLVDGPAPAVLHDPLRELKRPEPPKLSKPPKPDAHAAVDYDPRNFDVFAYLPRAKRLADTIGADARLVEIQLSSVFPDGHVDLTRAANPSYFEFTSQQLAPDCAFRIVVSPSKVTVEPDQNPVAPCMWSHASPPRCPLSRIWDKASEKLSAGAQRATFTYTNTGWTFSGGDLMMTFDDDCP